MNKTTAVIPYAWVILAVVYLASVMAPLNQFKVPPVMPLLMERFSIDLPQAGLLMSTIALVGLVLALPAGVILQRFGAKITGLTALACLAAGAALGAVAGGGPAGGFPLLLASRVVEGVGVGLISVVAPATIAQWFPRDQQGTPMGIWATWVPVGSVAMYNAAPALAARSGLPAVWWTAAGITAAAAVLFALFIRRPPAVETDGGPSGGMSGRPSFARTLANRDIWLLALSFMCFNLALVAFTTYYPTFLNTERGYELGQASFITSLGTMVTLISAPLAGVVSDRIGSRRLLIALPFLVVAVMLLFPFRVTGGWIIAVLVLQSLFIGAIPTATFAAAPEVMRRPELAGLGLAVILVGQNLGQLVGPVVFGGLVDGLGWVAAGMLLIPVCLVGFASAWRAKVR